jgi:enoyl-CoA hydratase/carnithine racemase
MAGSVRIEREGALAWILFDHAERRNAITTEMWHAIPGAVSALDGDPSVRVVVMRGAGDRAFVSGADISEFERARTGADAAADYDRTTARAFDALASLSKPLLAMIHGFCIGGGMATALGADLRYAAADAVFAIPAARLGLGYHMAGLDALARLVGPASAKEILFTARRYDASAALRLGLVNGVYAKADLEREVRAIATSIADNAPLTLASAKRSLRELARDPADRDHAAVRASILACFESDDYREGVRAFLEKRAPRFSGR